MSGGRWTHEQAWDWFRSHHDFYRGANFIPSSCSNSLEMWRKDTWGETTRTMRRELDWASSKLEFNAMRVFLHNLPFQHEGQDYLDRVDRYLEIASSLQIKTMLVLFDGCWDPQPQLHYNKQLPPRPLVHNSRWVQAPGAQILANASAQNELLKPYVQAVVKRFGNDSRVLLLDLFNEPDNDNESTYGNGKYTRVSIAQDAKGTELEPHVKHKAAYELLVKVHKWARAVGPISTPITVADWERAQPQMQQWVIRNSDFLSFHNFQDMTGMKKHVQTLQKQNRPLVCSEYMARTTNSTFDPILGYLKQENIWAFNWGLVAGKSQTNYPWDSWFTPYTGEPELWLHDVLLSDGSFYLKEEGDYILDLKRSTSSISFKLAARRIRLLAYPTLFFGAFLVGVWFVRRALKRRHVHWECGGGEPLINATETNSQEYGFIPIKVH